MSDIFSCNRETDPTIQRKIKIIEAIAKGDGIYQQMFSQLRQLEQTFLDIEPSIPPEYRDKMWDFFGASESMTHRLLELACLYMDFPHAHP